MDETERLAGVVTDARRAASEARYGAFLAGSCRRPDAPEAEHRAWQDERLNKLRTAAAAKSENGRWPVPRRRRGKTSSGKR